MIIVLNGALGVGKSTLAEALSESIDGSVMLDGDHLVAANPPVEDVEHLHSTLELLVEHHRRFGYRNFVVNHLWCSPAELADLEGRLACDGEPYHCFLLTLPLAENLVRIRRRATARAVDELEFELAALEAERAALSNGPPGALGKPLDASDSPTKLVEKILQQLDLAAVPRPGPRDDG